MAKQALAGLKVVELGSLISAPYATKLMADLGAEVIKVEEPRLGDLSRRYGPFPEDLPGLERSGVYQYLNANKLGLTADLSTATGRDLVHSLVREADVLVENLQPADVEAWGLDYPTLEKINPRLVVTSITPFGWTGPYRDYKGDDLLGWHASGAGHHFIGDPEREPLRPAFYHADHWAAVCAATATLLALHIRDVIDEGQHVDISVADVFVVLVMGYQLPTLFHDRGETSVRIGTTVRQMAPAGMMPCKDGYVYIMALEDHQWAGLKVAMGNPEWAEEPLFNVPAWERAGLADQVYALMEDWLMSHTKQEIFALCQQNRVPATAVLTTEELVLHPHLNARNFWIDLPTAEMGTLKVPGSPYEFTRTPWALTRRAPTLGEHNAEIYLSRLGFSPEELVDLRRTGII
jgi:crotonobetainyl-CoA:carnitine CoA-transferase CaiB-like acyl-CoA transferase